MTSEGMRQVVVVMAKEPVAGQVKTRLEEVMPAEECAELAGAMLRDTLVNLEGHDWEKVLAVWPRGCIRRMKEFCPTKSWKVIAQKGPNLFDRMSGIVEALFEDGADAVVLRGSDAPDMKASRVMNMFAQIEDESVDGAIVPDRGGGYSGLALSSYMPEVIQTPEGIHPGATVAVLECASKAGLQVKALEPHPDVDTPDDLNDLAARLDRDPESAPDTTLWMFRTGLLPLVAP